ncbi:hypothetical protein PPNSA23_19640 [Phyllobacterium phragmitis]|uniref:N-acetyltransferase domain-containing protein n=1 Tax=Phyllobacterium phragmitis TaxID=2670329 RepID=A0ABQ0GZC3_9HYPH
MKIREALECDAQKGSEVLRRSIAELCSEDHASDPDAIARWNANKTPEMWVSWVNQATTSLYIAEEYGQVVGVCMRNPAKLRFTGYAIWRHQQGNARTYGSRG